MFFKQNSLGICYHFAIKRKMRISKSECFQGFAAPHVHFFSFPLNRCRGFAGDVVADAVDAADFVDDADGDAVEDVVGDARPVGGHEIAGVDSTQSKCVIIRPTVAHDADGAHGGQNGEEMAHQRKGNKIAVVYNHDCEGIEELADYPVQIKIGADMENVLLGLDFILFAQAIALMKSLSLGITPDNPCPTGEVNRVVKGVTLYPYTLK